MDKYDENFLNEKVSFYSDLNDNEKQLIASGTFSRKFVKGEQLYHDPCTGVLIIKSGRLRVYLLSEEGRDITLYYTETNDVCIFSASCVLASISFEVHIQAEEDTEVLQISSSVFGRIISNNVLVENYALHLALEKCSDVMWAMQQLLFLKMDKRIAIFLVDEVNRTKSLELNITHENVAKSIGSVREVVTRLLQQFAKEGLVDLFRGRVVVKDKEGLKKIFNRD